ncbi:MAG: hypothetical protein WBA93_17450 [Microcoleaceae cyanobacterium]
MRAQTTQRQNNSNDTWEKVFQDFLNNSEEDPPVSHKDGTSRGSLCLVSPGLIEVTEKTWSTRPTFIWQGYLKRIEINKANSEEILWTVKVKENDQKVIYTGETLQPGNIYYWQVFDSMGSEYDLPLLRVTFRIIDIEESQAITQELEKLDAELNLQGATQEAITFARVKFFAERNLWSDVLSEAFAVNNPSSKLQDFRSNILQYFCQPSSKN